MILLVDIGNTRLKWAQLRSSKLGQTSILTHRQEIMHTALVNAWQGLPLPQSIYLSCVSSIAIKQVLLDVSEQLWPNVQVHEVQTENYAMGVTNAYAKPEKLGVDRWLAILAAYQDYTAPVCIVDCGTAITLDVVNQHGRHLGGMIMPGFTLMKQALQKSTANLRMSPDRQQQGLANNTDAAIFNGNLHAIKGFIEFGLTQYNKPLKLILTGGDAEFINDNLQLDAIIDTQLVFKGLALSSIEQLS